MRPVFRQEIDLRTDAITINGETLDAYGIVPTTGVLSIGAPDYETSYVSIPGRAGSVDLSLTDPFGGALPGRRKIGLAVVGVGTEVDGEEARLRLGAIAGREVTLRYRYQPGAWRGRLTLDDWDSRMLGSLWVDTATTITLEAEPYMVGDVRSQALTTGANLVRVGGNRPAWPVLTLTPVDGVRTVTVSDGHGHSVEVMADRALATSDTITVDMGTRAAHINGNLSRVDLASDYWPLLPTVDHVTCTNCAGRAEWHPLYNI